MLIDTGASYNLYQTPQIAGFFVYNVTMLLILYLKCNNAMIIKCLTRIK